MSTPGISIAIPTHNRPGYLREALVSVARQTVSPLEVIVIDDASEPPVDPQQVASLVDVPVRVFHNPSGRGLAWNRNKAVMEAHGDFILHLDDDDWLALNALERISERLQAYPDAEVIFLTLQGVGARSEHFNRVQPEGTQRLLARVGTQRIDEHCFGITDGLPVALLAAVPQSFQHPVVRREFWDKVTELRSRAYAAANGLDTPEEGFALIKGPLRDSEWAIYSAFLADAPLLVDEGLYLMRCEGQGAVSNPEQRARQMRQSLLIKRTLAKAAPSLEVLRPYSRQLRAALRTDLFNAAYYFAAEAERGQAWTHLLESARLGPQLRHVKLGLKLGTS